MLGPPGTAKSALVHAQKAPTRLKVPSKACFVATNRIPLSVRWQWLDVQVQGDHYFALGRSDESIQLIRGNWQGQKQLLDFHCPDGHRNTIMLLNPIESTLYLHNGPTRIRKQTFVATSRMRGEVDVLPSWYVPDEPIYDQAMHPNTNEAWAFLESGDILKLARYQNGRVAETTDFSRFDGAHIPLLLFWRGTVWSAHGKRLRSDFNQELQLDERALALRPSVIDTPYFTVDSPESCTLVHAQDGRLSHLAQGIEPPSAILMPSQWLAVFAESECQLYRLVDGKPELEHSGPGMGMRVSKVLPTGVRNQAAVVCTDSDTPQIRIYEIETGEI